MNEAGLCQSPPALVVQQARGALSVHGEQKHAAGRQETAEFRQPGVLHDLIKMSEYGKTIDDVEVPIRIGQRRLRTVGEESRGLEVLAAPRDSVAIDVGAMKFGLRTVAKEPTQRAPAPATEVQHAAGLGQRNSHQRQMLLDSQRGSPPDSQEFFPGHEFADAKSKQGGRHGDSRFVVRTGTVRVPAAQTQLKTKQSVIDASRRPRNPLSERYHISNLHRPKMHTEFRRAIVPQEISSLMAFDHRVFPKADWFSKADWETYISYWMIVGKIKVGCCAFQHHMDFQEDIRADGVNPARRGSLYISSTGILPRFQRMGFGALLKCWQIAYARRRCFTRIVTNTRKHNAGMIRLNRKFGFQVVRVSSNYYTDPADATVVMELRL